jgi:hypothetical protein
MWPSDVVQQSLYQFAATPDAAAFNNTRAFVSRPGKD